MMVLTKHLPGQHDQKTHGNRDRPRVYDNLPGQETSFYDQYLVPIHNSNRGYEALQEFVKTPEGYRFLEAMWIDWYEHQRIEQSFKEWLQTPQRLFRAGSPSKKAWTADERRARAFSEYGASQGQFREKLNQPLPIHERLVTPQETFGFSDAQGEAEVFWDPSGKLTKHLQGQHDQDTHGNRGKSYGDQEPIDPSAPRIQEAKTYQELKTLYGHENFPYFITPEGTVIASDRVNSHQGFLITVSKQYPELSEKMLGDLETSDELIETIATQRGYIRARIYGNTLLIHSKEVSEKALKDLQKMYDQGLFPKSGYSKIDWEGKDFGQNLLRFPEGSIGWTDIQSGKGTTIYVSAKAPDFFYSSRLKYDPVEGQVIVKLAKAQPLSPDFWAEESNQLIAVIKPLLEKIYATALVLAAADLKISLSYTIANASAVAWARNQTDILLSQLMKTTIEGVGPVIADWIQSPTQNMGDLHQSLSRFFDRDRASRVAITETTRAFAEAAQEQYTENGITHWRWNTNNDEYYVGRDRRGVCVVCAPLNGKVVKIGEPFGENRKGEPIIKPPDAHINDRCWVTPVVEII